MEIEITKETITGFFISASAASAASYRWLYPKYQKFKSYHQLKGKVEAEEKFLKQQQEKDKQGVVMGVHKIKKFFKDINEVNSILPNSTIQLLEGHNCGGTPDPTRGYFISDIVSVGLSQGRLSYDHVQVDEQFIDLLIDILPCENGKSKPYHIKDVDKLKPCLLRSIFKSEGLTEGYFYFIRFQNKSLFLLSVCRKKGTIPWTEEELIKAQLKINSITYEKNTNNNTNNVPS